MTQLQFGPHFQRITGAFQLNMNPKEMVEYMNISIPGLLHHLLITWQFWPKHFKSKTLESRHCYISGKKEGAMIRHTGGQSLQPNVWQQ
jgi:hypothetical protein